MILILIYSMDTIMFIYCFFCDTCYVSCSLRITRLKIGRKLTPTVSYFHQIGLL